MITLTAPEPVRVKLGSSATVGYDKMVLDNIVHSPVSRTITATVKLYVSTDPNQPALTGSLLIDVQGLKVTLTINQPAPFTHVTAIDAPSAAIVQGWINTAQQNVEQGLINVSAVAGVFSAGI